MGILALSAVDAAAVTGSSTSSAGDRQAAADAVAQPAPKPLPPASLPPVTEHTIDPSLLASARTAGTAGSSVTQTIQLTVLGGPLELVTPNAAVELHQQDSSGDWIGTLPPVRLIDARGTHQGWTVRWTVDSVEVPGEAPGLVPGAMVQVEPGDPTVVAGTSEGLHAAEAGRARPNGRPLFSADPGSGGGTYEVSGVVSVRLPPAIDADRVVVRLAFSVT